MKTINNFIKSILVAALLLVSSSISAATYYVCNGAALTLNPSAAPANITYSWDVKDMDNTTGVGAGASLAGYPRAGVPTVLPTNAGSYKILLISTSSDPATCAPDVVENTFVVLPTLNVTLGAPTLAAYCENYATPASMLVQSTTAAVPAMAAADLELEYSYLVSKDGGAAVDGTTGGLGTIDATTKNYTLNTTTVGSYVITASIKFKQKAGFTNTFLNTSGTGCPASSATRTVEVKQKLAAPTISIAAN